MTSSVTPVELKMIGDQAMKIIWSDGLTSELPARTLRLGCQCAVCVNEATGEKILRQDQVPVDVKIEKSDIVGNYALSFQFSDGHGSGIYSFTHLRKIDGK